MTKLVSDLMHRGLITCAKDTSLGKVAVLLNDNHVHSLVVVDRDNRPLGLMSDTDLMAGEWLGADAESLAAMRKLTAGDLMSYPILTVDCTTPLHEAAKLLIEKDVNRLLVTEKGKMVGVISSSDFVASIAKSERILRNSVADVMSDAILVCREHTPVTSAARAMTTTRYRSVVVVDAKGKQLGVVSEKDLLPLLKNGGIPDTVTVSDVMHKLLAIRMHASLREAADMMIQHHHHRVIVVDDNDPDAFPLGIVSSFDIVAEMARAGSVWQS
jgi:CBS domain-containing protein